MKVHGAFGKMVPYLRVLQGYHKGSAYQRDLGFVVYRSMYSNNTYFGPKVTF